MYSIQMFQHRAQLTASLLHHAGEILYTVIQHNHRSLEFPVQYSGKSAAPLEFHKVIRHQDNAVQFLILDQIINILFRRQITIPHACL